MKRFWNIALLGICLTLTGCGTLARFFDPPRGKEQQLYPATHIDGSYVNSCFTTTYNENYPICLLMPVIFADMPFAVALDTVLFPYDWYKYKHYDDYVHKNL